MQDAAPSIRLRTEVWRRMCAARGVLTVTDKAELLRVDIGTISRIERGSSPSARFMASAVLALGVTVESLFEITGSVAA